jgi:outer membrane protein
VGRVSEEEELIVIRTEQMTSAALAALLFAAPLAAQQPVVRAVTLPEAIKLSEQTQPAIISAQGTITTDQAAIRARIGSFLPSLSFSSSGSRSFSQGPSRLEPTSGQIISGNRTSQSVSLSARSSITLFDGFQRNHQLAAARASATAADVGLVNAKAQNALTVTTAFYAVLADQAQLVVDSISLTSAQAQLQVAAAKLMAGAASRSDSLTALVTMLNARQTLVGGLSKLAQDQANLGHLVGVDGQVAAVDDSSYYQQMTSIDTAEIRREALSASPSVRSAAANLSAARASLSASKGTYFPSLSLSLGLGYSGNQADSNYTLRQNRSLGISLSWPIFDNFSREQSVTTAQVSVDNAEATLADQRRAVMTSVTQQFAALASAQEQMAVARVAVEAAQENLRVVEARYRVGSSAATIVEVNTAQQALTTAENGEITARFAYLTAKAQLEALIGRSL